MSNEPAFPTSILCRTASTVPTDEQGMTLRDYFAAKAMQGELTSPSLVWNGPIEKLFADIAEHAYKMADAMMTARKL